MATVDALLPVPPERAFALLSRPQTYAFWVVGAHAVPAAAPDWPAPGTTFVHEQGIPPLILRDSTSVLECVPPTRLVLEARVRPLLVVRIAFALTAEPAGTRVTMEELPVGGALAAVAASVGGQWLIRARNREALRRLTQLAEEEARGPAVARA